MPAIKSAITRSFISFLNKSLFEKEQKERVIADFIAGMTDRYAINLYNKIK